MYLYKGRGVSILKFPRPYLIRSQPFEFVVSKTIQFILRDILKEMQYLPLVILLGTVLYLITILCTRRYKKPILSTTFISYSIMLVVITIFERESGSRTGVSLKFFETLGGPKANAYVVENVLLFIPFGILVPLKWKQLRNTFVCTFLGFCLSCVIEIMQLITERGHFQVDDILTNTLGALIGGIVFRAIFVCDYKIQTSLQT